MKRRFGLKCPLFLCTCGTKLGGFYFVTPLLCSLVSFPDFFRYPAATTSAVSFRLASFPDFYRYPAATTLLLGPLPAVDPFCSKSAAATGRMRRLALAPVWVGLIAAFGFGNLYSASSRRRTARPHSHFCQQSSVLSSSILTFVNSLTF